MQIPSEQWCGHIRASVMAVFVVMPDGTAQYTRLFDTDAIGLKEVLDNKDLWEFYSQDIRHAFLQVLQEKQNEQ